MAGDKHGNPNVEILVNKNLPRLYSNRSFLIAEKNGNRCMKKLSILRRKRLRFCVHYTPHVQFMAPMWHAVLNFGSTYDCDC